MLSSRLALTLGIFALIFTLPEIINSEKPLTSVPTIADSMLSIIIIATIAFTVSSVLSSNSMVQKRFPKHYSWIDGIVFLIVSSVVITYFLFSNYPEKIITWLIPLLIFALGYGLLLRMTSAKVTPKKKLIVVGGALGIIFVLVLFTNFISPQAFMDELAISSVLIEPKLITAQNYSGIDRFEGGMIYPTKDGGEEWYMNNSADPNDERLNYTKRDTNLASTKEPLSRFEYKIYT